MIKPLEILMNEHRVIEQVLSCLEKVTERCQVEGKLDEDSTRQALEFFRTFADRCHHGKEEAQLFPVLQGHGLGGGCGPVAVMLREHELGRMYIQGMEQTAEAASAGDPEAVKWFTQHARGYIRLLREHIQKEDHCLFANADRALGPEEERKLLSAFEKVEAEQGGTATHEQCLTMANQLADRYGVPKACLHEAG